MNLILLSPTKTLFDGEIDSVTIPGTKGLFTVLPHHAPLITTTEVGTITYKTADGEHHIQVSDGFAKIKNNIVSICIEKLIVE